MTLDAALAAPAARAALLYNVWAHAVGGLRTSTPLERALWAARKQRKDPAHA